MDTLRRRYQSLERRTRDPPVNHHSIPETKCGHYRNLIGFWLLGLCNNYAYVIMLSAAHDILAVDFNPSNNKTHTNSSNSTSDCNKISTGAILLADIIPSLIIKAIAPFIGIRTFIRLFIVIITSAGSFLLVSFSRASWMAFLGVICAAFSSGLGETTLLSYSSYFNKNVISTWSSGTGGSGIFGAVSYAVLTSAGISPRNTLLLMLIIPVIMAISFYICLVHPHDTRTSSSIGICDDFHPLLCASPAQDSEDNVETSIVIYFKEKISLMKPLWKYAIPLMLVYLAEYFINQGLLELIYFKHIWINHDEQYRWFQVDYQLGVFISRSSVNFFTINKLWLLTLLQFGNVALFVAEVAVPYLPSVWIVLALVLFEGLLGGAAYVNTYYKMRKELTAEHLPFSMAIVPLADTLGIAIAGGIALPVHDYFCSLK